jgi:hypothetical protein
MSETHQLCLIQFKWALAALARPGSEQIKLFPEHVCKADELALDFDHWYGWTCKNIDYFTPLQLQLLMRLNDYLSSMGGVDGASLFCDEALLHRAEWQTVRVMAIDALNEFGWPNELPPTGRSIYSGP